LADLSGYRFLGTGLSSYGIELQKNNLYGVPSNSPNDPTFNAWDGNQWAELDYTLNGVGMGQSAVPQIYQDLSTIQGASYLLSFYYTPRPDGGAQQLGVFGGNASAITPTFVQQTSYASGSSALTWTPYQVQFVATSNLMRIGFGSLANLVVGTNYANSYRAETA